VKPKVVKAWACGQCGALYSHEHGNAFAEACCKCKECGGSNILYTATIGGTCRACYAKKELTAAEENLVHAQHRLAKARANHGGVM
jgi:hypothetical protein